MKRHWLSIISLLFAAMFICLRADATLVIAIYNNNAIYLAADSLVTQGVTNTFITNKIVQVSSNCCVAIAGFNGVPLRTKDGPIRPLMFNDTLHLFSSIIQPDTSSLTMVDTMLSKFSVAYRDVFTLSVPVYGPEPGQPTFLLFVGYDKPKQYFFGNAYTFSGTNDYISTVMFQRGTNRIGSPITFMGEIGFLSPLFASTNSLFDNLLTEANKSMRHSLLQETALPSNDIKIFILEMFRLHLLYAAKLNLERGLIGEPYDILKLTKDGIARLN